MTSDFLTRLAVGLAVALRERAAVALVPDADGDVPADADHNATLRREWHTRIIQNIQDSMCAQRVAFRVIPSQPQTWTFPNGSSIVIGDRPHAAGTTADLQRAIENIERSATAPGADATAANPTPWYHARPRTVVPEMRHNEWKKLYNVSWYQSDGNAFFPVDLGNGTTDEPQGAPAPPVMVSAADPTAKARAFLRGLSACRPELKQPVSTEPTRIAVGDLVCVREQSYWRDDLAARLNRRRNRATGLVFGVVSALSYNSAGHINIVTLQATINAEALKLHPAYLDVVHKASDGPVGLLAGHDDIRGDATYIRWDESPRSYQAGDVLRRLRHFDQIGPRTRDEFLVVAQDTDLGAYPDHELVLGA